MQRLPFAQIRFEIPGIHRFAEKLTRSDVFTVETDPGEWSRSVYKSAATGIDFPADFEFDDYVDRLGIDFDVRDDENKMAGYKSLLVNITSAYDMREDHQYLFGVETGDESMSDFVTAGGRGLGAAEDSVTVLSENFGDVAGYLDTFVHLKLLDPNAKLEKISLENRILVLRYKVEDAE